MSFGISQIENRAMIWKKHQVFAGGSSGGSDVGNGNVVFVDGDRSLSGKGDSWNEAFITVQEGVTAAGAGGTCYVVAKTITDYTGDPNSYAETIIIPYANTGMQLIGVSRGRTQGGLPQVKIGAGAVAMCAVRAPGCLIANMGFNGASSTGGGILLDDDYAAKAAFGTSIYSCHFKNCKNHATNGSLGGAIYTTSAGNAWQVHIAGNRFYKNVADIVLVGTGSTVPQDWVIEDNVFSGPAANVDINLYLKGGGSGINGVIIRNNTFTCFPNIGSGTNANPFDLTGCVGIMSGNHFAWPTNGAGKKTQGATGDDMNLPAAVILSGNHGECDTELDTGIAHRTA